METRRQEQEEPELREGGVEGGCSWRTKLGYRGEMKERALKHKGAEADAAAQLHTLELAVPIALATCEFKSAGLQGG